MRLIFILPFASVAVSLGINCRGSSNCGLTPKCHLSDLILQTNDLDPNTDFAPGDHIACCGIPGGNICAFVQSTDQHINAGQAVAYLEGLHEHGCEGCGSIPFQDNDVDEGQLTVNWVSG